LLEEVPVGSNIKPIAPIHFAITDTSELVNLKALLAGTGYENYDDLDYCGRVNGITNRPVSSSVDLILTGKKYAFGKPVIGGEFHFSVLEDSNVVATGTNSVSGEIVFSKLTYTEPGVYEYLMKEDGVMPLHDS